MKKIIILFLACAGIFPAKAQLLKKVKDKVEDVIVDEEKSQPVEKIEIKEVTQTATKEIEKNNNEKVVEVKQALKPQILVPTKTDTIPTEVLPDNYFKIQLASYDEKNLQFPEFEHLGKVEMVQAYDRYIYRLGIFTDLDRAKQILDEVRTKGYFVAFILQYNKDKVTGIVK